jgi:hypothetical protein
MQAHCECTARKHRNGPHYDRGSVGSSSTRIGTGRPMVAPAGTDEYLPIGAVAPAAEAGGRDRRGARSHRPTRAARGAFAVGSPSSSDEQGIRRARSSTSDACRRPRSPATTAARPRPAAAVASMACESAAHGGPRLAPWQPASAPRARCAGARGVARGIRCFKLTRKLRRASSAAAWLHPDRRHPDAAASHNRQEKPPVGPMSSHRAGLHTARTLRITTTRATEGAQPATSNPSSRG